MEHRGDERGFRLEVRGAFAAEPRPRTRVTLGPCAVASLAEPAPEKGGPA